MIACKCGSLSEFGTALAKIVPSSYSSKFAIFESYEPGGSVGAAYSSTPMIVTVSLSLKAPLSSS